MIMRTQLLKSSLFIAKVHTIKWVQIQLARIMSQSLFVQFGLTFFAVHIWLVLYSMYVLYFLYLGGLS